MSANDGFVAINILCLRR